MEPALGKYEINRRTALLIAISVAATATLGGSTQAAEVKVITLTSFQLAAMLEKKDFFFVNVHTPYEKVKSKIPMHLLSLTRLQTILTSCRRIKRQRSCSIVEAGV